MAFDIPQTPKDRLLSEALDAASRYFSQPNASGAIAAEPISKARVLDRCKARYNVWPRQWCMAYIRWKYPDMSYPRIAKIFRMKDHTTIMHAQETAKERYPDAIFCQPVDEAIADRLEAVGLAS